MRSWRSAGLHRGWPSGNADQVWAKLDLGLYDCVRDQAAEDLLSESIQVSAVERHRAAGVERSRNLRGRTLLHRGLTRVLVHVLVELVGLIRRHALRHR